MRVTTILLPFLVGTSAIQTSTCLAKSAQLGAACATGPTASCCAIVLEFNNDGCWCNPAVIGAGGDALSSAEVLVGVCSGGAASTSKPGSPNCPAPENNLGCSLPGAVLKDVFGAPIPDEALAVAMPVSDMYIDALRLGSLNALASSLKFDKPIPVYEAIFEQIFTPDAIADIRSTGRYVGPQGILEYLRLADYNLNSVLSDGTSIQTILDPSSFDFAGNVVTYETFSTYCFGKLDTAGELTNENCVQLVEAPTLYSATFEECSGVINSLELRIDDRAVAGLLATATSINKVCSTIQSECTGEYQQYDSVEDCLQYLTARPRVACQDFMYMGPSFACTWLHTMLTFSDKNHCFHTGKEVADLNGKFKCSVSQCPDSLTDEYYISEGLSQCSEADWCGEGYYWDEWRKACKKLKKNSLQQFGN